MSTSTSAETVGDPDLSKRLVRQKYARVAHRDVPSCCAPCCGGGDLTAAVPDLSMIGDDYADVAGYEAESDLGLGCGIPTENADLREGQTVLDLGSGAGVDAFVARREVGAAGRVVGVDFTPEMVERARRNADRLGYGNVAFVEGDIEALPVESESVDVVLSNCVLNLVPDKARAFAEAFRVLKPGGHLCVSDVVSRGALPKEVRRSAELYAGCVAGAVDQADYLFGLRAAGFEGVEIRAAREVIVPDEALAGILAADGIAAFRTSEAGVWSVTVFARRPVS